MKIATFNINNINKRLEELLGWLRVAQPDVACLQELEARDAEFPQQAIKRAETAVNMSHHYAEARRFAEMVTIRTRHLATPSKVYQQIDASGANGIREIGHSS